MYVILVNKDNTLVATKKSRIIQGSKMVDKLWFLVPPYYGEYDMSYFTVLLEYILPISKNHHNEKLVCLDEPYNGHLVYTLPIDSRFTEETGSVELTLTFICKSQDKDENIIQHIRKTLSTTIDVLPVSGIMDSNDTGGGCSEDFKKYVCFVDELPECGSLDTIYIYNSNFYFWDGEKFISPSSGSGIDEINMDEKIKSAIDIALENAHSYTDDKVASNMTHVIEL